MSGRNLFTIAAIIALLMMAAALSLSLGAVQISPAEMVRIIGEKLSGISSGEPKSVILFSIRLPRVVLAFFVGAALSLAGVILQALFRNPLVEPYTLGISGGAGLAVSLAVFTGAAVFMPAAGFAGAVASLVILYLTLARTKFFDMTKVLLSGVMLSFISSSLVMLIISLSRREQTNSILFWIMGDLGENDPMLIAALGLIAVLALLLSYMRVWSLNALSLGDEEAAHLGIDIRKDKRYFFVIASMLTGVAVSAAGIIGFVGLLVPHMARRVTGSDHRAVLWASFIMGGVFLMFCDAFGRFVFAPLELPVGIITGIAGGLMFLYQMSRTGRKT